MVDEDVSGKVDRLDDVEGTGSAGTCTQNDIALPSIVDGDVGGKAD